MCVYVCIVVLCVCVHPCAYICVCTCICNGLCLCICVGVCITVCEYVYVRILVSTYSCEHANVWLFTGLKVSGVSANGLIVYVSMRDIWIYVPKMYTLTLFAFTCCVCVFLYVSMFPCVRSLYLLVRLFESSSVGTQIEICVHSRVWYICACAWYVTGNGWCAYFFGKCRSAVCMTVHMYVYMNV